MDYRLRRISDKYISAGELPVDVDLVVTIDRIVTGDVTGEGGKITTTGLLYFKGWAKAMVLNSGNGKTIRKLYGKDDDAWLGKAVSLYRSTTKVGGDPDVPCIRVRPAVPKSGRADPQPNEDAAKYVMEVGTELEAATSLEQLEAIALAHRERVAALPKALADTVKRVKAAMVKALTPAGAA